MITKSHFMHEAHPLVLYINTSDYNYLCNGCKTLGKGQNFRCLQCNFDMHEFCIDCPRQLASFLHPQHDLYLLVRYSQSATSVRICDVCGDGVNGLYYCCQSCNFNVHPLCTQFPQSIRHQLHGVHHMAFRKPSTDAACSVCEDECNSWRYRCEECDGFDIHIDCLTKPCVPPPSTSNSTHGGSTSRCLPPYAGTYTYGGVNCSPSPNPNPNPSGMYNPTCAYHGNPHNMCNSCAYSGTPSAYPHDISSHNNQFGGWPFGSYQHNFYNGALPPPPNLYNIYMSGTPYKVNSSNMYNINDQIPYGSHTQNVHTHQAQNVQSNSSQGHGSETMSNKVFGILRALSVEVICNMIAGAISGDPPNYYVTGDLLE